ncbi:unnamed protein product [Arctogadus glacialis]
MLVTRLGSLVLLGAPLECTGVHRQREGNSSSCTIDVTRASEPRAGRQGRARARGTGCRATARLGSRRAASCSSSSAARRSSGLEPKPVLDPARDQDWTRPGTRSGPGPGPGLDPARDQVCLLGRAEPAGASLGENSTPLLLVVVVC